MSASARLSPRAARLLLNYAALCLVGQLLLASVYAAYWIFWLFLGDDGPGGLLLTFYGLLTLIVGVGSVVVLRWCADHEAMTAQRARATAGFFGALTCGYLAVGLAAANPVFAWTGGTTGVGLLPLPALFLRPGTVEAVQALPADDDWDPNFD